MQIQQLDIKKIRPYGKNPRKNDKAVKVVVESIERYGFQQPIVVDKTFEIIVGHTRYKAAQELNLTEVPVLVADTLTDEQVQAYRIADNKTNEYAQWDDNLLAEELRTLMNSLDDDLREVSEMTALTELEIDRLLNGKGYNEDAEQALHHRGDIQITQRVALVVLKSSYVNRGVATYINGWLEWGLRTGVQVDVISNGPIEDVANNQFDRYTEVSNWIAPERENDSRPDYLVTLRQPIIKLKECLDLRTAIVEALSRHTYDAIILNTVDVLYTVVSMGLDHEHPNIYYATHSPNDVGRGQDNWYSLLTKSLLEYSPVKILCQSARMKQLAERHLETELNVGRTSIEQRLQVAAPPLGQPELLEFAPVEQRQGILFIGPYEENKGSETFIECCHKNNLPALLITPSQQSADKFKRRFLELGIAHEIHVSLTGVNKVLAMRKAAVAVIPSTEETFCYTALEAAHVCRCIIPLNRDWTDTHKDWCIRIDERDMHKHIQEHYAKPLLPEHQQALKDLALRTDQENWQLLAHEPHTQAQNNALTKWIEQTGSTTLRQFYRSRPKRVQRDWQPDLDELFYAIRLQNHRDYEITHTKEDTLIAKLGYTRNTTQEQIDSNLMGVFNIGDDNDRT